MSRLKDTYINEVAPALNEKFGYKSVMQTPKLEKIVLNMGVGDRENSKTVEHAAEDLTLIAGQKAVITKAKKSIANFHLREGMEIGTKVTLRGERMYEFLDRFISVAVPRVRDFRGLSANSFDGRGNYSVGMKEQLIFLHLMNILKQEYKSNKEKENAFAFSFSILHTRKKCDIIFMNKRGIYE